VASTIWRTVHDQKDRVVYFYLATSPTVFWMPLDTLDFTAGSPVRRLPLKTGETYSGDVSPSLSPAEPFVLLEAAPK
jgi:penicillin V acylase-like amidase (Ntn superfamily)